jgi:hypothetical protein
MNVVPELVTVKPEGMLEKLRLKLRSTAPVILLLVTVNVAVLFDPGATLTAIGLGFTPIACCAFTEEVGSCRLTSAIENMIRMAKPALRS